MPAFSWMFFTKNGRKPENKIKLTFKLKTKKKEKVVQPKSWCYLSTERNLPHGRGKCLSNPGADNKEILQIIIHFSKVAL